MSTRNYDFVTGIETSAAPTQSDPSADGDFIFKDYADRTYALDSNWGLDVADYTALKAVSDSGDNARADGQVRLVQGTGELWYFEASSSATDDGATILQPTSGTGRWLIASGGGGSSSGSASNLEALQQKNKTDSRIGSPGIEFDNSASVIGYRQPVASEIIGNLIQDYTASDTEAYIVWDAKVLNDSDKEYDATTNWSATGAGASLSTSASDPKVGANTLTFDKNNSAAEAAIRYDRTAQNLSLGAHYRVWFWLKMPSVTDLSNVLLRVYADTTSNYRTWTTTTNFEGGAIATGWNLIAVDISTGGSASGSGWTYTELSRYVQVGVTTGNASQTYTGIEFGGLWFSFGDIDQWEPSGLEFTILDTSNKDDIVIDEATAFKDGEVTLNASIAQGYTAGISNSDAATVQRNTLEWISNDVLAFDEDLSSGEISLEQEVRIANILRESFSGNIAGYVDYHTPLVFKLTAVGGWTIDVEDPNDFSADLLDTESLHIFTNNRMLGRNHFTHLATRAMTANASHSSGTTTLTVSPTSISVGDYVVKQELSTEYSLTAISSPENFGSFTLATSPQGAQLLQQGFEYPNKTNLVAHWRLGAATDALAVEDIAPVPGDRYTLNEIGTVNMQGVGRNGRFSATGWSASNYLRTDASTARDFVTNGSTSYISVWVYMPSVVANGQAIVSPQGVSGGDVNGWYILVNTSEQIDYYGFDGTGSSAIRQQITSATLSSGWYHVFLKAADNDSEMWVNGVSVGTDTGNLLQPSLANPLYIGASSNSSTIDTTMVRANEDELRISDLIWWNGGTMGQAEATMLYNSGLQPFIGYRDGLLMREEYSVTGVSGQRMSMKTVYTRATTGVAPYIQDMGITKV